MPRRPRSQFEEGPRSAAAEEWEEEEAGEFEPPRKRPRLANDGDDESDESHHDGDGSVDGAPATATNDDVPDDILARARSTLTQVLARRERIQYAHQVPPPPTASVPQQQRLPMVAPPPPATQRRQPPPPPLNPVGPRVIVPTGGPGSVVPPAAANTAATVRRVTFVPLSQIVADTRAAEHRAVADAVNAAAAAAGVAAAEAVGGGGGGPAGAVVPPARPPAPVGSHCFVCGFGNRAFDGGDMGCRPYVTLINMMVDDYGHMDNAELGLHMHDYYHKQLYNPAAALLAPGEAHPLPRMTAADFVAHIERHTLDPIIIIGENTRMLRDVIEVVRNQLVDEQTRDVDVKKVDALVKLVKAQKELLSVSASSLLFGGGAGRNGAALVLDPSAVGAVANTRRIAPLLATASGTIGGATAADTGAARGNVPVFNGPAAAATAPGPPMLPI